MSVFSCVVEGTHSLPGGDIQPCTGPDVAYAQNLFRLMHCVHTKQILAQCSVPKFILQQTVEALVQKRESVLFNEHIVIIQQKIRKLLGFQKY
jgi:hypothetical protein